MSIEEFIEARIAEDERIARATTEAQPCDEWDATGAGDGSDVERSCWSVVDIARPARDNPSAKALMEHIARHDPARVLRQCAALRAVLQYVETMISPSQQIEAEGDVLYPFAAIWSDHPDYQQDWGLRT